MDFQCQTNTNSYLGKISLSPDLTAINTETASRSPGVIVWPDVDENIIMFDHQPDLDHHPGPSPSLILQVIFSNDDDIIISMS